jgi:cytochrome oxidase Cu insertion factor (SCO1/SenC/PrrC family)
VSAGLRSLVPVVRHRRSVSALGLLGLVASACSSGPPGPPPASAGTTETRVIPASITEAPLVDQRGDTVTLASLHGKTVMLVPFLTLCSDICPLTTGNLLQVEQSLSAAHLANKVEIVELSVDPGRDTTARLAAYAHLTQADWALVNESHAVLSAFDTFFGFSYQVVPQDNPPAIDWMTGQPLAYDVNHSDGYVLIGPDGTQRYSTGAAPDFHGSLNPKLHAFLNSEGLDHLAHPLHPGWNPSDALASLGWILGQSIPLHTGS